MNDFIWFKFIQLCIDYAKTSKSEFFELFSGKNGGLLKLINYMVKYAHEKVRFLGFCGKVGGVLFFCGGHFLWFG